MRQVSWTYSCLCGQQLAAETEDDLVLATGRHVSEDHPSVGQAPLRSDVLSMAQEVDDE